MCPTSASDDVQLLTSSTGQVYSLGRAEYGRLGLGKDAGEKSEPTPITGISDVQVIACGASVSFAVTKQGENTCCPGLDALQPPSNHPKQTFLASGSF